MKIRLLSEAKPGARCNVDLFGHHGRTAWLLDGATSSDGPALRHDAYWLVHKISQQFASLCGLDLPLPVMVERATAALAREYPQEDPTFPRAALALVRMREDRLEMLLAGNVSVIVGRAPFVTEHRDARVTPGQENKDDGLLEACRRGVPFEDPEFKRLRGVMKHLEAASLARQGALGLLAPRPIAANELVYLERPISAGDEVLLASDGFMELKSYWNASLSGFFHRVCNQFSPALLSELRAFETAPESGVRLPRTKRHDDATVAWLAR